MRAREKPKSKTEVMKMERTINTTYLGYDNTEYKARMVIDTENLKVLAYEYYDEQKEEWIDTEEKQQVSKDEIEELLSMNTEYNRQAIG